MYAGWTSENYTVTLNLGDNGILAETTATVAFNQDFKLAVPKSKDATKIFAGWRTQPNGQGVEYTDLNGDSKVKWLHSDNETVLYASWYSIFNFTEIKLGEETGWAVTKANGIYYVDTVEIPAVYDGLPVLSVDTSAFKGCTNLKTIRIPDTIRYVAMGTDGGSTTGSAFEGCTMLEQVVVYCVDGAAHDEHDVVYESDASGALFRYTETNKEIVYLPMTATGTYYIPEGVTSIPFGAFRNAKLTKISIPASVTNIASAAFADCYYLTDLEFRAAEDGQSEKALTIDMAFEGCMSLEELTLPARLVNLNFDIFSDCDLTKIKITGNAVDNATSAAYYDIDGVLCQGDAIVYVPKGRAGAYTIPSVIKTIGQEAFARCVSLTKVVIPGHVTLIEKNAFLNCTGITSVVFQGDTDSPDLTIQASAFYYCRELTSVTLPENLTYLAKNAFGKTTKLTEVILNVGENATLETGAFADNNETYYVVELYLGANVKDVDIASVFGSQKLSRVYVDAGNTNYSDVDGVLFNKEATKIVYFPLARGGHYDVPEGVTEISANIFRNKKITSVSIPTSVKVIDAYAFCNSAISSVEFKKGGTEALVIGISAFENTKLTELEIPARVTAIGDYAFARLTKLNKLTFETVEGEQKGLTIGEYAFAMYDAKGQGRFPDDYSITSSIDTSLITSVVLPARLDKIEAYAFYYSAIENLVIPEGVETIENYAFAKNASLKTVSLPATLTTLGARNADNEQVSMYVFDACAALESITVSGSNENYLTKNGVLYLEKDGAATELFFSPKKNVGTNGVVDIPKTVTKIWDKAFYENKGITSITFSDGLDGALDIGSDVFSGCTTLVNVQLPYGVSKIGTQMFYNCSALQSIEVPASVSLIEVNAFAGCKNLSSLTFAETPQGKEEVALELADWYQTALKNGTLTTYVDNYVFKDCAKLTSIDLPSRTTKIGSYAFWKTNITSISIPEDVTSIGESAFAAAPKLQTVVFDGNGVTEIPKKAFENCYALTNISIPASVKSIGERAFVGCNALTSVTFAEGLETIAQQAFYKVPLQTLSLPASLTTIGDSAFMYGQFATISFAANSKLATIEATAFAGNEALTTVIIPASVKTIGLEAFDSCSALSSVTFGENSVLEEIKDYAFAGSALTTFAFPESTATLLLGKGLFADCTQLGTLHLSGAVNEFTGVLEACTSIKSITVSETSTLYSASAGSPILYSKDKKIIYYVFGTLEGEVVLDANVTKIDEMAFKDKTGITSVTIKDKVVEIGESAFEGCTNLATLTFDVVEGTEFALTTIGEKAFYGTAITSLTIPKNVTTIGKEAFKNCKSLTTLTLNSALETVGAGAFYTNTALANLTLPEGLTIIGESMFYGSALTSVTIPASVKTIGKQAFYTSKSLATIDFAPNAQVEEIGDFAFASTAITSMTIPNTATTLGKSVFQECKSLTSVTLPEGIEKIPDTFFKNSGLTAYEIPSTVKTLGANVFYGTALKSITIPETIKVIPDSAFYGCKSLVTVDLPAGLTEIKDKAFYNCTTLKNVNFSTEATATERKLGANVFYGCTSLVSITLPSNLTEIGASTFSGCTKLASINIPESVKKLGNKVFEKCTALTSATLGGEALKSIGTDMFYNCKLLATVVLREGLTMLGEEMFGQSTATYSCQKLKTINFPSTLTSIPKMAFMNILSL